MYNYIKDLIQFFQDLEDGYFMQHSLDVSLVLSTLTIATATLE